MFGNRLLLIRKFLRLTQLNFGSKIGVAQSVVATYEANHSLPSFDVIAKIYEVFNINPAFLLAGHGDMFLSGRIAADKKIADENITLRQIIANLQKDNHSLQNKLDALESEHKILQKEHCDTLKHFNACLLSQKFVHTDAAEAPPAPSGGGRGG